MCHIRKVIQRPDILRTPRGRRTLQTAASASERHNHPLLFLLDFFYFCGQCEMISCMESSSWGTVSLFRGQSKTGRFLASFSFWAHSFCFQLAIEEAKLPSWACLRWVFFISQDQLCQDSNFTSFGNHITSDMFKSSVTKGCPIYLLI